jgi:endoglucanase
MGIKPDFAIALDTTIAWDTPGATAHESVSKLGNGIAVKIMDGSVVSDSRMINYMRDTAKKLKIKWQSEMLPAGGTDTGYMQRMTAFGSIAGAISVPTRHIHSVVESCNSNDVKAGIKLLGGCILQMDKYKWDL